MIVLKFRSTTRTLKSKNKQMQCCFHLAMFRLLPILISFFSLLFSVFSGDKFSHIWKPNTRTQATNTQNYLKENAKVVSLGVHARQQSDKQDIKFSESAG